MQTRYDILLQRHCKPSLYLRPQDFLASAIEYFKWCEDNPLQEEKRHAHVVDKSVVITRTRTAKVRSFTKTGLAQHMGLPVRRLEQYRLRSDAAWADVFTLIDEIIYTQKFENAAAGLLNATIIGRDLGLADRQELSGINGEPIRTEEVGVRERITGKLASLGQRERAVSDTEQPE